MKLVRALELLLVKSIVHFMEENNLTYYSLEHAEFKYDIALERHGRLGWYFRGYYYKDDHTLESFGSAIDIEVAELIKNGDYISISSNPQKIAENMKETLKSYWSAKQDVWNYECDFKDAEDILTKISNAQANATGYQPQKATAVING